MFHVFTPHRKVNCALNNYVLDVGKSVVRKGVPYRDEDGDMKVLSFVGLPGIMAYSVSATFAFLKAMMLELHRTMPLLNTIHFVTDCPYSPYRNSSISALAGQTQMISTPNNEGKRPLVICCTTCQLSLAGSRPRQG